jgi:hypothetical protein
MRARTLVLLAALALPGLARAAADASFEAIGRAPISGGDRVRARQRALDEAFGKAIESAVSALLGAETLTRRAADLRLKILPKAKSYVMSYHVLDEGEVEAGFYDVHVNAELTVDRLRRELADRSSLPKTPVAGVTRALLCFSEMPAPPRLDAALRAMLSSHGLEPVPAVGCSGDEMVRAARSSGARIVLVAEISAGPVTSIRGTALVGREGKLLLRLHEPDGRRSAEGDGDAAGFGVGASQATDDLGMRALAEAGRSIESALGALGGGGQGLVTARLLNVHRLTQVTQVRTALERLPGVETVEPRRFLPGTAGTTGPIELAVRTAQPARAIAAGLARVAASYQARVREEGELVIVEMQEPVEPTMPPPPPDGPTQ